MSTFLKQPCDEGIVRGGRPIAPCAPGAEPWVLAATILGSSMAFIDGTVVNVALPVLQVDLHATVAQAQWIVEAYALFLAALILVGGSLGDHFGRRRVFALGVAVFAAASAWCGLAPDANALIAARAAQGIGGALLTPGSLAIIGATFGEDRRGRAIGTWSGATAATTAIGPVLGGWLVEHASWRWVFFLNIPLAVAVLAIAAWRVPESRDEASARLDGWGAILATLGLGGVTYALIESGNRGLGDPAVISALGLGAGALALFLFVEAHSSAPMMPLDLFHSRTFGGANLLTLLLYGSLAGALFFVPFNLVQVQGYSATAAGAALLPFVLIMSGLSRWSGGLVNRYGAKLPLVVGPVFAAIAAVLYAIPGIGGSYWATFFPAVTVQGLGMAITVAPLTTVVMGAVDARHTGLASGINNAVARTAGLLSVALMGIVVVTTFNWALDSRLATLALPPEAIEVLNAQRARLAGAEVPAGLDAETAVRLRRAIDESFVDAFRLAMLVGAGLALAGALSALALIEGKGAKEDTREETDMVTTHGCTHLNQIRDFTPSASGCEDCLKVGGSWVHLRLCLSCGHVGCCDNSPNRHATGHFRAAGHPIIRSFEPGEAWGWCYVDELYFEELPTEVKREVPATLEPPFEAMRAGPGEELPPADVVEEASRGSFPASDAPGWVPGHV